MKSGGSSSTFVLCELNWTGHFHAPFNAALIGVIRRAFPKEKVFFFAESRHLDEVRGHLDHSDMEKVEFVSLDNGNMSDQWSEYRTYCINGDHHPLRRIAPTYNCIRSCLREASKKSGGGSSFRTVVTSGTEEIICALLMLRLSLSPANYQIVLHGNVSEIVGWRSRRPLWRFLDLRSMLQYGCILNLPFVVLEEHIPRQVAEELSGFCGCRDFSVLPHPVPSGGDDELGTRDWDRPVVVGYAGLATPAKGFDKFLRLAELTKKANITQVKFTACGSVGPM